MGRRNSQDHLVLGVSAATGFTRDTVRSVLSSVGPVLAALYAAGMSEVRFPGLCALRCVTRTGGKRGTSGLRVVRLAKGVVPP